MLVIDTCLVSSDATYGDVIICTPEPMSKSAESNYLISKTDKEGRKTVTNTTDYPTKVSASLKPR